MKKKLVMICVSAVFLIGTFALEAGERCVTHEVLVDVLVKEILRLNGGNQEAVNEILNGYYSQIQLDFAGQERCEVGAEQWKKVQPVTVHIGYSNNHGNPCFKDPIIDNFKYGTSFKY